MATIFTRIINGEIPCYKIAENDKFLAFLDINPISKGHTLVVSKLENDYIFDLSDDILADILVFSKKIAKAIDQTMDCQRTAVSVIGLEVPHTHVHLIPINSMTDYSFSKPKLTFSKEEFEEIASNIRSAIK